MFLHVLSEQQKKSFFDLAQQMIVADGKGGNAVMFFHVLNEDQKKAFFEFAADMLTADGEVDDSEIHYMDQLIREAGLTKKRSLADEAPPAELDVFDSQAAKMAFVVEILILSVIDGHYHVKESAYANDIIDRLGIDEETHEALCRLTNDAVKVLDGMRELADADGG
ncbi:MAG: hypothetical protein OXR84_01330 [Magnetovibrio sp.]|nr:hypothetical protein [Magnetovibrio sp.]